MFCSADILNDDGHLFFALQVSCGLDVGSAAVVEYGGVDALNGLVEHSEHLVFVLRAWNHVCGIDSSKWLIVTVFQLGTGAYCKRRRHCFEVSPQLCYKRLRKSGCHKF